MKNLWNSQRGSGTIRALGLAFVLLIAGAALIEVIRLNIIARNVQNAIQSATTETCVGEYADIYNGIREGYSGGYILSSGKWTEKLSPHDIYASLDSTLGTQKDGSTRVKYSGTSVDFRITDLFVQIDNVPFAPGKDQTEQLTCITKINLEVPLLLHWDGVPPMHAHITVKGGYMPKF